MDTQSRRTGTDRRVSEQRSGSTVPYDGEERRVSDRRSGRDRRKSERIDPA